MEITKKQEEKALFMFLEHLDCTLSQAKALFSVCRQRMIQNQSSLAYEVQQVLSKM